MLYLFIPAPRPTAFPHYTLATSDLENLFHESRNSVSHRNRGDRNRSFNYFQCCKFPLTTVSRQLAQDLNPCLSLLQVITVLKSTVWSHFNYFILYLGVVHLIISKANSFLNSSSSYVRSYVRTEKVLSWQGIFFSLDPVLLF